MASMYLLSLLLLSTLSLSSPFSTENILNASEALANFGYVAMSLTLRSAHQTILPAAPSSPSYPWFLTIFAPPDTAFVESGQPSLSLVHFHLSPTILTPQALKSFPPRTKIPTFFIDHSLIVTSSPFNQSGVSLNGVNLNSSSPIYQDQSIVVYLVDRFFDPAFEVQRGVDSGSGVGGMCSAGGGGVFSFGDALALLRSKKYSIMASYIEMQLVEEYTNHTLLTVFAPLDKAVRDYFHDHQDYGPFFKKHVVPCKFYRADLVNFDDGIALPTYVDKFVINVTTSGNNVMVNGVKVISPDMYNSSWLVIHGVEGSLASRGEKMLPGMKVVLLLTFCRRLLSGPSTLF